MKKLMVLILSVFLFAAAAPAAKGKLILNLYGTCMDMAANSFTNQESSYKVYFEAKAAYAVSGNFYIWASHGQFPLHDSWKSWDKKSSFDPDILVERTVSKRVVAGGAGFYIGYFEPSHFGVRAEVGLCSIGNAIGSSVSAIDTDQHLRTNTVSQRGIGARGNLSISYGLYRNIFAEISAGYMHASDKIDDVRSNLGGFHLAAGLGIQL